MGHSQACDGLAIVRYVHLLEQHDKLSDHIGQHGTVTTNRAGEDVASPQFTQLMKVCDALLRLEVQLGMTPAARTRLPPVEPPPPGKASLRLADFKTG